MFAHVSKLIATTILGSKNIQGTKQEAIFIALHFMEFPNDGARGTPPYLRQTPSNFCYLGWTCQRLPRSDIRLPHKTFATSLLSEPTQVSRTNGNREV